MATATDPVADPDALPRSKPPFLRRVRIRNYKSIAFCDVTLEPLTLLVGRNGSGKSNFLDALAFVRDVLATNAPEAVQRRGGWTSVHRRTGWGEPISFSLDLSLDGPPGGPAAFWRYEFDVTSDRLSPPRVLPERLRLGRAGGSGRLTFEPYDFNKSPFNVVSHRGEQLLLPIIGDPPSRNMADRLRRTGYYNFHVPHLRKPQQSVPGSLLEDDGRNLAGVIETVRRIDPNTLERVGDFLAVIVPEVAGYEALPAGGFDILKFYLRQGDGPLVQFDAANMSDGTLRALATLVAVYQVQRPSGPSIVGIEEPETALHPAAANALVGALDEASLSTQVIITTHSADLLDHPDIRPENVRVVRMIDGRTVIGRVDEAAVEIVKDGLNTLGGLERDDRLDIDWGDLDQHRRQVGNPPEGPA